MDSCQVSWDVSLAPERPPISPGHLEAPGDLMSYIQGFGIVLIFPPPHPRGPQDRFITGDLSKRPVLGSWVLTLC